VWSPRDLQYRSSFGSSGNISRSRRFCSFVHDWRAVAALYAGLYFNLVVLHEMGVERHMTWVPLSLMVWLSLGGLFLARGVFWPAATSGLSFTALLTERLGRRAAMLIKWVLLPVWLVSWFGANSAYLHYVLTGWPMSSGGLCWQVSVRHGPRSGRSSRSKSQ